MTDTQTETTTDETPPKQHKAMTLWEHLGELRARMVRSVIVTVVLFVAAFGFAEPILLYLREPLIKALPAGVNALHFTGPMDVFIANIKVAFLISIILGCPVWLYQFWRFIEPALYDHERKYILPFIVASVGLFLSGVLFCYYVMVPTTLKYLIGMGISVGVPIITVGEYVSLLAVLIIGFGVVFETPLILIILAMMDILSYEMLSKNRKAVVVIILIIAAILTPTPDPVSQLTMAIPTYLMYEASLIIIRMIKGKS